MSRPTSWGKLLEKRVFRILDTAYQNVSDQRLFHPEIKYWSGAPDFVKEKTVCDCKSPYSLEVFCDKIQALGDMGTYKEEFPEDYWQHLSNSILLNANGFEVNSFEAIIYVPYQSELEEIRKMADGDPNYYWLQFATDEQLPYLIEGGHYKNINVIEFDILQRDIDALTERVLECGVKLLSPF